MKVNAEALHAALVASARIANRKSTIPVLSHVRIEARTSDLVLSVTDLEVSRQQSVARCATACGCCSMMKLKTPSRPPETWLRPCWLAQSAARRTLRLARRTGALDAVSSSA